MSWGNTAVGEWQNSYFFMHSFAKYFDTKISFTFSWNHLLHVTASMTVYNCWNSYIEKSLYILGGELVPSDQYPWNHPVKYLAWQFFLDTIYSLKCPKVFCILYSFVYHIFSQQCKQKQLKRYKTFIDNCLKYSEKNRTFLTMRQTFQI